MGLGPGASKRGGQVLAMLLVAPVSTPPQGEEIRMLAIQRHRGGLDDRGRGLGSRNGGGRYRNRRIAQSGEPLPSDVQDRRQRFHLRPLSIGVPRFKPGDPAAAAFLETGGPGFLGQG